MKISSITLREPELTVDIEVAESHTYQLANGAVSHNTTSKLFGLTEGWHLAALAWYLRWVQFRQDDPLVKTYDAAGYPTRSLKTYTGTTIVGFPTQPAIGELGMGDELVTASEATPEDQYEWLKLGERFYIVGTDEKGVPLHAEGQDRGNQISYTLKYDPEVVSYEAFRDMLVEQQSQIRCCSVLPVTDTSAYEYCPEEMISKGQYEGMMQAIRETVAEDIGFEHVDCGSGGCPISFNEDEKAAPAEPEMIYAPSARSFIVYTKADCHWCDKAKALLIARGFNGTVHQLDRYQALNLFTSIEEDSGIIANTMPQIWEVDAATELTPELKHYIGGYADLDVYLAETGVDMMPYAA